MWHMGFISRMLSWLADILFPPKDTAKLIAECTAEEFGRLVAPRVDGEVTSLLPYRHPLVRAVVIEAKFAHNPKALSLLGTTLREYIDGLIEDSVALGTSAYVLIPIPLGPTRRRERGYNQIEEVMKAAGLTWVTALERTRDTAPQTSLSRANRLQNMNDAFAVCCPIDIEHTYIVLDDVTTTGATLAAAANALRASGAENILMTALAH